MLTLLLAAMFVLGGNPDHSQVVARNGARDSVAGTISAAIATLESKDYKTFLTQFVVPEQVKTRASSPAALATWVDEFSSRADKLLAALKYVQTKTPTYNDSKMSATFDLSTATLPKPSPPTLILVKIDKSWYIGGR